MTQATTRPNSNARRTDVRLLGRLRPVFALIVVVTLFALPLGPSFLSWSNLELMLIQTAIVGVASMGASAVIIAGGIDLAVGSNLALAAMSVTFALNEGVSPPLAAILGILVGAWLGRLTAGLVAGKIASMAVWAVGGGLALLVPGFGWTERALIVGLAMVATRALAWVDRRTFAHLELSPFVVTLGLWGAVRGLAKGLGANKPIYATDNAGLLLDLMSSSEGFGLAPGVILMFLLTATVALVLRRTVWGRHVYAIGSNPQNARLCGVSLERTRLGVYVLAGACAGVAGILNVAYLYGVGKPDAGTGLELAVIASVVIGGASLQGGRGSPWGTLIGALTMTVVATGCTQLELDEWLQNVVTGAIIVAAVVLDQLRQRSRVA